MSEMPPDWLPPDAMVPLTEVLKALGDKGWTSDANGNFVRPAKLILDHFGVSEIIDHEPLTPPADGAKVEV